MIYTLLKQVFSLARRRPFSLPSHSKGRYRQNVLVKINSFGKWFVKKVGLKDRRRKFVVFMDCGNQTNCLH